MGSIEITCVFQIYRLETFSDNSKQINVYDASNGNLLAQWENILGEVTFWANPKTTANPTKLFLR